MRIVSIESELTFIVDSDDCIIEDAVASILKIHKKYQKIFELCGYAFFRTFSNGKINGKKFNTDEKIDSYIDFHVDGGDTNADKAEVFLTRCMKKLSFQKYSGEKFLREDLVWVHMVRKYKMVYVNEAIYVGNYHNDGLIQTRCEHNIVSLVESMNRANLWNQI